jgi:excisionase family DNA binding protein
MNRKLTVPEVCEALRLTRKTLYKLIAEGRIPAVRIGGKWLFDADEVENALRAARQPEPVLA